MGTKDFDVDEITFLLDGGRVVQIDAVGWDTEKGHEKSDTVGDDDNVWVLADEDPEVSFSVKATSESIPDIMNAYQDDETVDATVKYSDTEPLSQSQFLDGKIMSFGPADDYEDDDMPMWEGEAEFDDVEHS